MSIIAAAGTVKALVAVTISLHPGTPHVPASYTVQRGDSLWSVAAWYYGSGASWPRIWAANRAVVGPDPNVLRPGEHLTFP